MTRNTAITMMFRHSVIMMMMLHHNSVPIAGPSCPDHQNLFLIEINYRSGNSRWVMIMTAVGVMEGRRSASVDILDDRRDHKLCHI